MDTFIYSKPNSSSDLIGYLKTWNTEIPALLTKMQIVFYSKSVEKGYSESKPARFERLADRQFLMRNEDEVVEIHSVKKLIKNLDTFESELTSFAKKGKISTSDPEELALLIAYYHELQQL